MRHHAGGERETETGQVNAAAALGWVRLGLQHVHAGLQKVEFRPLVGMLLASIQQTDRVRAMETHG